MNDRARRALARVALVVAVVSLLWATGLLIFGGFSLNVMGVKLASHEPTRLIYLGILATALLVLIDGIHGSTGRLVRLLGRVDDRLLVVVLAIGVFVVALRWGTVTAGGSDSYGYISEARLWAQRDPIVPMPWAKEVPWPNAVASFAPLGYKPLADQAAMVPTYPPGLSFFMAAAQLAAGDCAVFWVVPAFGAVFILATYLLGRRLVTSRVGVVAAWLVATSAPMLFSLVQPVTDVPAAAVWTVVCYLVLRPGVPSALGAGLACGLAALIRPNLAPFTAVFFLWYALRAWRGGVEERRVRIRQAIAMVAGVLPGAIVLGVINHALYGSALESGYGNASGYFSWVTIKPNVMNYALWFVDVQTALPLVGIAALLVPFRRVWPTVRHREFLLIAAFFVFGIWAQYCAFLAFDVWWYLRFLLPCWPLIMIGTVSAIRSTLRPNRPILFVAAVALFLAVGVRGVRIASDRGVFGLRDGEHKYVTVAEMVRDSTDPNSIVFALQHTGSLRHYGGRVTVRFNYMEAARVDRDIAWLTAHGAHAYALLEEWELAPFRTQFASTSTGRMLDRPPVLVYDGPNKIFLYDLAALPGEEAHATRTVRETYQNSRCPPPAQAPRLTFTK